MNYWISKCIMWWLLNQLFVYILGAKGGDLHGKHGAAGWGHRRGVSSGGDETGSVDSNVQMPHLSVCADSHKVDRTKLAQSEVRNEKNYVKLIFFEFLKTPLSISVSHNWIWWRDVPHLANLSSLWFMHSILPQYSWVDMRCWTLWFTGATSSLLPSC